MESLDAVCQSRIVSFLTPTEAAVLACVGKTWNKIVTEGFDWQQLCTEHFHVRQLDRYGEKPCADWRTQYNLLRREFRPYGAMTLRARLMLEAIQGWGQAHLPALLPTLEPGLSEKQLREAEVSLGHKLPLSLRVVYRFFDGQKLRYHPHLPVSDAMGLPEEAPLPEESHAELGVLGGMSFYDYSVYGGCDGFLRWMEAYAAKLTAGGAECVRMWDSTNPYDPHHRVGLCQYGLAEPTLPDAELHGTSRRFYSYSIRMRLLSIEDQRKVWEHEADQRGHETGLAGQEFRPLRSAQLQSRHWNIWGEVGPQGTRELVDEVRGEGVIGDFPLLTAGGEEYVYQSCTQSADDDGAMDGSFYFVPGTLDGPMGPGFAARCPWMTLRVPAYIY
ncbi:hypothetical protein WJX73_010899 [Symbiochloris irregularis]|uniref:ApaG domain-containing protein n=1 Tax=Symbiochloris irregularis TaxID=706552 RepID=A0AAW1Q2Z3_9CHLO